MLLARLPAPLKFLPCCLCMQNIDNKDPSSLFAPLTRPRKSFALLAPRLMSEVGGGFWAESGPSISVRKE